MATYIEMPKLSDTMTEGTLVRWLKQKGDKVVAGDILAEVETDKATMEMESFDDGVLSEIYVPAGQKVAIGQRIAMLLAPGESAPAPGAAAVPTAAAAAPSAGKAAPEPAAPAPAPASMDGGGRVKASPLARKIAAEKGVDLSRLTGSGPAGRDARECSGADFAMAGGRSGSAGRYGRG